MHILSPKKFPLDEEKPLSSYSFKRNIKLYVSLNAYLSICHELHKPYHSRIDYANRTNMSEKEYILTLYYL